MAGPNGTQRVSVAIIGAGPAGLAAAVCLGRRGVDSVVLERGERALASMRQVDPAVEMLTPTRLCRLPGMRWGCEIPSDAPTYQRFDEIVAMLERYRARHRVRVICGAAVERIEHIWARSERESPARFAVICADGTRYAADAVVNATGIIGDPQLPADFDPAAFALPWWHSLDVRQPDILGARRLLVIGGGTSAGEVLETWLARRRPGDRAWLSLRSPLWAVSRRALGVDLHYWTYLLERFPARALPARLRQRLSRDPIIGAAVPRAIRRGHIAVIPAPTRYEPDAVAVADGRRLTPDMVVFATGFRYRAAHLGELVARDADGTPRVDRCQSTRTPGLYLLGLRFGRDLASPYLRGIARDARYVAARIAADRASRPTDHRRSAAR